MRTHTKVDIRQHINIVVKIVIVVDIHSRSFIQPIILEQFINQVFKVQGFFVSRLVLSLFNELVHHLVSLRDTMLMRYHI